MNIELSVILPKYNHKTLAEDNILRLHQYLSRLDTFFEIIVVDDGSKLEERLDQNNLLPNTRLIQFPQNCGKGAAIKTGMLEASGKVRVFIDIDLPYDLSAIPYSFNLIKNKGLNFVAGDRSLLNSYFIESSPLYRKIISKIFSKMVTSVVIGGIFDSQCGFKAFSGKLANALFPLLTIDRFSFDVEIYYLLLKYNILIRRIPVCLVNSKVSTINIVKHALPMAIEVLRIPFNWYSKKYVSAKMLEFMDAQYWLENKTS